MATLKTRTDVYLPGKLAARLKRAAAEHDLTTNELILDALLGFLRMVEEAETVPQRWRAVPIDDETEATIREFATELGDAETLHLETAVCIYFDRAAETKRATGNY